MLMRQNIMITQILKPTLRNIKFAAKQLRQGKLVAIPTETVYGLAAIVWDKAAVKKIFKAKKRPYFDPLIVHIPKGYDYSRLIRFQKKILEKITEKFWPGPLTLVLPKNYQVPSVVTSGLSTVAIRQPAHSICQKLLMELGEPLVAPSANQFGKISPTSAQAVKEELGGKIPYILDGGPCRVGIESTVILVEGPKKLKLLRPGGVSIEELEKVLKIKIQKSKNARSGKSSGQPIQSPGLLKHHYAPKKPLILLPTSKWKNFVFKNKLKTVGLLLMQGSAENKKKYFEKFLQKKVICKSLSSNGELSQIAQNLYKELRFLDQSLAQVIFCEPCTKKSGLGLAIQDRLTRAAHKIL